MTLTELADFVTTKLSGFRQPSLPDDMGQRTLDRDDGCGE